MFQLLRCRPGSSVSNAGMPTQIVDDYNRVLVPTQRPEIILAYVAFGKAAGL